MCPKRAAQMTVNQSMDRGARRRASSKSGGRVGSRCHEESSCSRYSCAAVSLRATRIGPPQRGQCQSGATSVGVMGAGWGSDGRPSLASSVRARGNICFRKRLASRPKWRMRTKRRGSTWRKKRRKFRRWTAFTPPQCSAYAAPLWPSFALALIPRSGALRRSQCAVSRETQSPDRLLSGDTGALRF